ncbi:hypothetical protein Pelo_10964 [Pelomyxa schiedti]|nr:hypothetical protein Pelo_10964 [Pelomyxa schiedti]
MESHIGQCKVADPSTRGVPPMSATCAAQAVTQYILGGKTAKVSPTHVHVQRTGRTVPSSILLFYGIGHEGLTNLHAYIDGSRGALDLHCSRESAKQRSAIEWITSCVIESHLCEPLVGERAVDRDDDLMADDVGAEKIPSMRTFYRVLEKKFPFILHECITTQTRCTICDKLRRSKADALRDGLIGTIDAHTKLHLGERQYQDHMPRQEIFQLNWVLCAWMLSNISFCLIFGGVQLSQGCAKMFLPSPLARQTGTAKNRFQYKKLYLTFDNAAVNKCMASFLYCGMLVAKQWVRSIEIGMLLPGHGLQDQLFSSLHYPLHAQDALTVPAFLELCRYFSVFQCKEISEIIKILPPSESARSWWKCLIDHPAAVFPGPNPASSLWDENNFWSTTGFIPCNARLTVPPITTQASVFFE